jgi:hypothetical protein
MRFLRFRFAVLVAMVAPLLVLGGITAVPAFARACQDPAIDQDIEYAGDVDVWCDANGVSPVTTPTPSPIVIPLATPSAVPASVPSPTQGPTYTPGPTPPPATGTFPVAYFAPDFVGPATRQFTQQFITQAGNYVNVTYPAGSSAPSSGHPGGAQARLTMTAGPLDNATLTYWLRFPVGFQFVKGGKLPGLCGGQCWTGSNNGAGGWATRFMWRAGGAGEVLLSDATTTGYGTDLGRGSWTFLADGQWHILTQTIHMNTPGVADGSIDATYNGVQVGHFTGITFRAASDAGMHIDSLMFCTFYGGHDSTWAPTADMNMDFASFHIS